MDESDNGDGRWNPMAWLKVWVRGNLNPDIEQQPSPPDASTEPSQPHPTASFFVRHDNLDEYPRGWPVLARTQNCYHNGSIHRRFGTLRQRFLYNHEVQIAQREAQIHEMDKEDEAMGEVSLRSLTPEQMGKGEKGTDRQSKKQEFIKETHVLLNLYTETLIQDIKLRERDLVDPSEVYNLYRYITNHDILDEAGRYFLREIDDFITTSPERIHDRLEFLLFRENRGWCTSLVKLFLGTTGSPQGAAFTSNISSDRLKKVLKFLIMALVLLLLLLPVFILLLAQPNKGVSSAVVLIFGLAVVSMMLQVPKIKFDVMFVGLSAYVAVLATFLANSQNNATQCACH
ncbi:hypothetical protein B0T25DRAFT_577462 [Lasiosphaeria hispida]|uniref:DUF6594 domain-containing protein n=1 Tax=Lasiosphaeria hispida TaxID=260671 RepID=A0AAJ0HQ47_9PEZI|nr:hypothetical protein B0T25DRAFT_577462 [Lasiosphaeria hispida]